MKPFGEIEHAHREGKLRGFKHYHAVAFAISGRSIADERKMLSPRGGVFLGRAAAPPLRRLLSSVMITLSSLLSLPKIKRPALQALDVGTVRFPVEHGAARLFVDASLSEAGLPGWLVFHGRQVDHPDLKPQWSDVL